MLEVFSLKSQFAQNGTVLIDKTVEEIVAPANLEYARQAITNLAQNKKTAKEYPRDIAKLIERSPWIDSGFGSYFATVAGMKTTYGPRIMTYVNQAFDCNANEMPLQIGSGVGCVKPYQGALDLLGLGNNDPERITQYDSPGGIYADRIAAALLLNDKIAPGVVDAANNKDLFRLNDVYITPGATNALDVAFTAWGRFADNQQIASGVCVLGPSYYMTAMGAWDKGFGVSRLIEEVSNEQGITQMLPSPIFIESNISTDTNLLVLTSPNNPNGEMYSADEFKQLLNFIQQTDRFLLLDLVFDQLIFDQDLSEEISPLALASEMGLLDRIIVVDGLSKNLNLAGARIGLVASKNNEIERQINRIMITSMSNPSLTIGPLLQFEAMARIANRRLDQAYQDDPQARMLNSLLTIGDLQKSYGDDFLRIENLSNAGLLTARNEWVKGTQILYESLLSIVSGVMANIARPNKSSANLGAYNTFVGLESQGGNQGLDKIIKMFTMTGVVPMGSECFGRENPADEFWTRITYGGLSRKKLATALTRIISFLDVWDELDMGNPNKFPVFNREIPLI